MGWASGSYLMSDIISAVQDDLSKNKRKMLYEKLIPIFQGHDWDTEMECLGEDPVFDKVLEELHPDGFEEEEEEDGEDWREFVCDTDVGTKFWRVRKNDGGYEVWFGAVGTEGQVRIKALDDLDACDEVLEKLITAKLKKGYTEDEDWQDDITFD